MVSNVTNAESVVVDVFVIHISVFYAFDILNDAESEWKRKDFVGCFCDDLCDHQPQHDVEGQDGTSLENEWEKIESQRKEDEAVHAFACQGGEDGAHGEMVGEVSFASVAHFQRHLNIGYNHASQLADLLEERGIIGPQKGVGLREIKVYLENS